MTRGYSNFNPGNIRISKTTYQGEVTPSKDTAFKQFSSMAYGYRAMFMLLYSYRVLHGCDTIRKIINRWAPSSENNTEAYVSEVSSYSGIDADTVLSLTDATSFKAIVGGMSYQENGIKPNETEINDGYGFFLEKLSKSAR